MVVNLTFQEATKLLSLQIFCNCKVILPHSRFHSFLEGGRLSCVKPKN